MNIWWPFVSKDRFADREREILELRRELRELKENHERILDEINFRSTGFHLYERFYKKEEVVQAASQPSVQESPASGLTDAINKVGRRPSAVRSYMEQTAAQSYETEERKAFDAMPSADVLRQIDQALALGTQKAQQS